MSEALNITFSEDEKVSSSINEVDEINEDDSSSSNSSEDLASSFPEEINLSIEVRKGPRYLVARGEASISAMSSWGVVEAHVKDLLDREPSKTKVKFVWDEDSETNFIKFKQRKRVPFREMERVQRNDQFLNQLKASWDRMNRGRVTLSPDHRWVIVVMAKEVSRERNVFRATLQRIREAENMISAANHGENQPGYFSRSGWAASLARGNMEDPDAVLNARPRGLRGRQFENLDSILNEERASLSDAIAENSSEFIRIPCFIRKRDLLQALGLPDYPLYRSVHPRRHDVDDFDSAIDEDIEDIDHV